MAVVVATGVPPTVGRVGVSCGRIRRLVFWRGSAHPTAWGSVGNAFDLLPGRPQIRTLRRAMPDSSRGAATSHRPRGGPPLHRPHHTAYRPGRSAACSVAERSPAGWGRARFTSLVGDHSRRNPCGRHRDSVRSYGRRCVSAARSRSTPAAPTGPTPVRPLLCGTERLQLGCDRLVPAIGRDLGKYLRTHRNPVKIRTLDGPRPGDVRGEPSRDDLSLGSDRTVVDALVRKVRPMLK